MSTKLLTINEAAEYLTLSKDYLYRLTSLRKIPFVKIGSRVMFRSDKLQEWIEEHSINIINN